MHAETFVFFVINYFFLFFYNNGVDSAATCKVRVRVYNRERERRLTVESAGNICIDVYKGWNEVLQKSGENGEWKKEKEVRRFVYFMGRGK